MSLNKAVIPLGIFLVLAALFMYVLTRMDEGEYNPRDIPTEFIGKPAPHFSLPELYDPSQQVTPEQFKGKPWLLNVFGTWCAECWREHEYLVSLAQRGVPIVGLNWRDDAVDTKGMMQRMGDPYTKIAFDPHSEAAIDWGVYGAPETFLIDAQGVIRAKHKGPLSEQVWQQKFARYFKGENS